MLLFRGSIFFIFGIVLVLGQADDYYYSGQEQQRYDDPLRRTLGLLGRVLNRMAQKDPPTDEQLHFQVSNPPDIEDLSSILRQQRTGADRIVSEELLNKLIPRVKGQTSPPRTSPTTTTVRPRTKKVTKTITTPKKTTPTTTTTVATTTTTTTEPTTTTTTAVPETNTTKSIEKNEKSSLTVRVKSLQEMAKNLPTSSELNDEDLKQAHIIAEALRILLNKEETNETKIAEKLKEMVDDSISSQAVEMVSTPVSTKVTVESEKEKTEEKDKEDTEETEEEEAEENEESEGEDETTEGSKFITESTVEESESTINPHQIFESIARLNIPEAEEEEPTFSSENVSVGFQESGTSTTSAPQGQTVYNLNVSLLYYC